MSGFETALTVLLTSVKKRLELNLPFEPGEKIERIVESS